jgi:hypothetical protein
MVQIRLSNIFSTKPEQTPPGYDFICTPPKRVFDRALLASPYHLPGIRREKRLSLPERLFPDDRLRVILAQISPI